MTKALIKLCNQLSDTYTLSTDNRSTIVSAIEQWLEKTHNMKVHLVITEAPSHLNSSLLKTVINTLTSKTRVTSSTSLYDQYFSGKIGVNQSNQRLLGKLRNIPFTFYIAKKDIVDASVILSKVIQDLVKNVIEIGGAIVSGVQQGAQYIASQPINTPTEMQSAIRGFTTVEIKLPNGKTLHVSTKENPMKLTFKEVIALGTGYIAIMKYVALRTKDPALILAANAAMALYLFYSLLNTYLDFRTTVDLPDETLKPIPVPEDTTHAH